MFEFKETAEADLRKRALSAAYGRALQWRRFSVYVDPNKFLVVSQTERPSALPPEVPLRTFDLHVCATSSFFFCGDLIYLVEAMQTKF